MSEVRCEIHGCSSKAEYRIHWGYGDGQQGNFCNEHIQDLWKRCQPMVMAGKGYWIQGPMKEEL